VSVSQIPDPNGFEWRSVAAGFNRLVDLADLGDGSGWAWALEQDGRIRAVNLQSGEVSAQPVLDLTDRVGTRGSERGLLGIALDPQFANNGRFYVNYTDLDGDTVIARYTRQAEADSVDAGSETILLQVAQPYANHNGGGLAFGLDGYLYIGLGDGGSGGDPQNNGQALDTLLGKLLRLDVRADQPAVPTDNPFAGGGGRPEIWAYGLRNPWRFSFDRLNGDLYIGDVGQNIYEEINYLPAGLAGGANFGWRYREGLHAFKGTPPAGLALVDPIYEYAHGPGCSVTGGVVYRGQELPEWQGVYLFSDYCSGVVTGLLRGTDGSWQAQELYRTGQAVSSFAQDQQGEVYLLSYSQGEILRLVRR
jgi:glucose/arabinose dehydrogenase